MSIKLSRSEIKHIEELKAEGNIPRHVAIIMDGNGRWAKKRNLPRVAGHQKGVDSVRAAVETSAGLGIEFLTLYTFSTENWKRPQDEVTTLMRLIVKSLQSETDELNSNNIRLTTIGDMDSLPSLVKDELKQAKEKTAGNTKLTLNLALSYSGRWELTEAIKNITTKIQAGTLKPEEISEDLISDSLSTAGMPDPDLLIRSGGELRVSNFLLWQLAYSELYVSDVLWPEFRCAHFLEAIKDYQKRERRFGLVSEQISGKLNRHKDAKKNSPKMANT